MENLICEADALIFQTLLGLMDSPVDAVKNCIPGVINTIRSSDLKGKIDQLKDDLLKDELSYQKRKRVYQFLVVVARSRADAKEFFTRDFIVVSVRDLQSADQKGLHRLADTAGEFLLCLSDYRFHSTMRGLESLMKPVRPPPCSALQTYGNLVSRHVSAAIPYVANILPIVLSMVDLALDFRSKMTICNAIQAFGEAICSVPKERTSKIHGASMVHFCDYFREKWLRDNNTEIKEAVIKALCPISAALPEEQMEKQFTGLIPSLLKIYGGNVNAVCISKTLMSIMEMAAERQLSVLKKYRDLIFFKLFSQVSSDRYVQKNKELFGCFIQLALFDAQYLIEKLLIHLQRTNKSAEITAVIILNEIIKAKIPAVIPHASSLTIALQDALGDDTIKIKTQVIRALESLAHSALLFESAGGTIAVRVIEELACAGSRMQSLYEKDEMILEDQELCEASISFLRSMAVTYYKFMLPILLKSVVNPSHTPAIKTVSETLIETLKAPYKSSDTGLNDLLGKGNFPSTYSLLTHILVNLVTPHKWFGQGIPLVDLLSLLNLLEGTLHPKLEINSEINDMRGYLSGCDDDATTFDAKEWETLLSNLVIKVQKGLQHHSLELSRLFKAFVCELETPRHIQEKTFLGKAIGILLVATNIDNMQQEMKKYLYKNDISSPEWEVTVAMFKVCAAMRVDPVLSVLEEEVTSATNGFLSKLKTNKTSSQRMVLLMEVYGHVIAACPRDKLLQFVDLKLIGKIIKLYSHGSESMEKKVTFLKVVSITCQAIEAAEKIDGFHITQKLSLLNILMDIITAEPVHTLNNELRGRAMDAMTALSKFQPALTTERISALIPGCLRSVITLPPLEILVNAEVESDAEHIQGFYHHSMRALKDLLRQLQDTSLEEFFNHVPVWITRGNPHQKGRAIEISAHLLDHYRKTLTVKDDSMDNLGGRVALFAPHITDEDKNIRLHSWDAINAIIHILHYRQNQAMDQQLMKTERDGLENGDSDQLLSVAAVMAKDVAQFLSGDAATRFVDNISEECTSVNEKRARTAAIWLLSIVDERSHTWGEQVCEIISLISSRHSAIRHEAVRTSVSRAVYILSTKYTEDVVTHLLQKPLPYIKNICLLWHALAETPSSAQKVLHILLKNLNRTSDQKETSSVDSKSFIGADIMAVTSAMREVVLAVKEPGWIEELFPQLFSCLLQQTSRTLGQRSDSSLHYERGETPAIDPCGLTVDTLKVILQKTSGNLHDDVELGLLSTPEDHQKGIAQLARFILMSGEVNVSVIVDLLLPLLQSPCQAHLITGTAFFSEVVCHPELCKKRKVSSIIKPLMKNATSCDSALRCAAIQGLGNAALMIPNQVKKYSTRITEILISGIYENQDEAVVEQSLRSVVTITKYLKLKEQRYTELITRGIALLDNVMKGIQLQATLLLGELAQRRLCRKGTLARLFSRCLTSVFLKLHSDDALIVSAGMFTLYHCLPLVGCKNIRPLLQGQTIGQMETLKRIYLALAEEHPEIRKNLLAESILFLSHITENVAAAKQIGFLIGSADS